MPVGWLITRPLPVLVTVSTGRVKRAVTMRAALIVTVQVRAVPAAKPPRPPSRRRWSQAPAWR